MVQTVVHTVGNRELILGIDEIYREAMKRFEVEQLLPAARQVADALSVEIGEVPVEGYYGESPELTAYFQTMRALQQVSTEEGHRVEALPAHALLQKVVRSPIFGVVEDRLKLYPPSRDALYFAPAGIAMESWTVETIVAAAYTEAVARNDCSLVGLACRARDPVCIAALRESVVLYAEVMVGASATKIVHVYEWAVDSELEQAANRFIDEFNQIVPNAIQAATPKNAAYFHGASMASDVSGRCVRIGCDDSVRPMRHYHWAVDSYRGEYVVKDFWRDEIWTTDRYRGIRR